nr:uncharacterized protein LOC104650872 [Saimiri boliviensis boliviensis]
MLLKLAFLTVKDGSPLALPSCPADVMGADAGGCQESEGKGEAGSGNPAAPATGAPGPGSDFQNPHPNYRVKPKLSECSGVFAEFSCGVITFYSNLLVQKRIPCPVSISVPVFRFDQNCSCRTDR